MVTDDVMRALVDHFRSLSEGHAPALVGQPLRRQECHRHREQSGAGVGVASADGGGLTDDLAGDLGQRARRLSRLRASWSRSVPEKSGSIS
jgi:hypothetical protein